MNGNRFYVQPADPNPGLQGLNQALRTYGEKRRVDKVKQGALGAYQSMDPDKIAEYALQNPEIAEMLMSMGQFRSERTKQNFLDSAYSVLADPSEENISRVVSARKAFLGTQGQTDEDMPFTGNFMQKYQENPEQAINELKMDVAGLDPKRWKAFREAFAPMPAKDRYKVVGGRLVDISGETPKVVIDDVGQKPMSAIGKLQTDLKNGIINSEDYTSAKAQLLNPKSKNKAELTALALNGDQEAKNILNAMADAEIESSRAKGQAAAIGKIEGLQVAMDLDGTAKAILEGRETIENVKNTFGVPIQETVRQKVLEQDPSFNFVQPRAIVKSLNSSLLLQQKNRGMMGSFVKNINDQVDRLSQIGDDIIKRIGVRGLDVPIRELNVRFKGSGNEAVFAAYMKEISAEIAKLSQGSAASIAQLPEQNRQEWEKIHDPNLSMRELRTVLDGTKEMANIRLQSVQSEIENTIKKLGNVKAEGQGETPTIATQEEYDSLPSGSEFIEDGHRYRKP